MEYFHLQLGPLYLDCHRYTQLQWKLQEPADGFFSF